MPSLSVWLPQDVLKRLNDYMDKRGTKNFSKALVEMLLPLDNDTLEIVSDYRNYQEGLRGQPINFIVAVNELIRHYRRLKDINFELQQQLKRNEITATSTSTSTSDLQKEKEILDSIETLPQTNIKKK
jgi:hypothetical protein